MNAPAVDANAGLWYEDLLPPSYVRTVTQSTGRTPPADPEGSVVIARLDRLGVARGCIWFSDFGPDHSSQPPLDVERCLRWVCGVAGRSGGRLIALAGVHPDRSGRDGLLETALKSLGAAGTVMAPDSVTSLASGKWNFAIDQATTLGKPCFVFLPDRMGTGNEPAALGALAASRPNAQLIVRFGGREWSRRTLTEAAGEWASRENILVELGDWFGSLLARSVPDFKESLRILLGAVGADRVVWGGSAYGGDAGWLEMFDTATLEIDQVSLSKILSGNALRVLPLPGDSQNPRVI